MTTDQLCLWFLYFIIYSFLGWLTESIYCSLLVRHWVERGFLTGPICPIYGSGAMLALVLLAPYSLHPVAVFFISMVGASVLEFVTSWLMEAMFHMRWWDYSDKKFNLQGRVCLENSLMFGTIGVLLLWWIHPAISGLTRHLSYGMLLTVSVLVLLVFLADLSVSVVTALNLRQRLDRISRLTEELQEKLKEQQAHVEEILKDKLEDFSQWRESVSDKTAVSAESIETYLRDALKNSPALEEVLGSIKAHLPEIDALSGAAERIREGVGKAASNFRLPQIRMLRAFPNARPSENNESMNVLRTKAREEIAAHKEERKHKKHKNKK